MTEENGYNGILKALICKGRKEYIGQPVSIEVCDDRTDGIVLERSRGAQQGQVAPRAEGAVSVAQKHGDVIQNKVVDLQIKMPIAIYVREGKPGRT